MSDINARALQLHKDLIGKIEVISKIEVDSMEALSLAYTPGVAEPCRVIADKPETAYDYTARGNMVAVVSDGTAVLGLGDIGPLAAMPVMEGKSVLFKKFAGVDAFPICLNTKDVDEIVQVVKALEPTFGGVNLEDISAPRCFEIEARLKKETNIPIFHDDQHGTAVVAAAAMINALKVTGKKIDEVKVAVNGAGAGAMAVTKLLMSLGIKNVIMCDSKGALWDGRTEGMNPYKDEIARKTNPEKVKGKIDEALRGADVFLGLSKANQVTREMVQSMAKDPIIFAMANPTPEIMPDEALAAGAAVVGTGRSDFPNQVNNVLGFPGIFRGALDVRATDINEEMKVAAAYAIANLITDSERSPEYIIPKPFDPRVAAEVAGAVAQAAIDSGVATIKSPGIVDLIKEKTRKLVGK